MMILAFALVLGVVLGLVMNVSVPAGLLTYLGVIVLGALDACLGGVRASLERTFRDRDFIGGFAINVAMAGFIVFLGSAIGLDELYLAAAVAFVIRMFANLAAIRGLVFERRDEGAE